MPQYSTLKRTHTCGELRAEHIGSKVRLNGWLHSYRNLGGVLFLDLRDRYGLTQVMIDPEKISADMLAEAERARHEFVVAALGTVRPRPEGSTNPKMPTGEVEVAAEEFFILSESQTPPFEIVDNPNARDVLKLEYRYIDLRRRPLQDNLKLRHNVAMAVRNNLSEAGFLEIETPLLIRSTPEGARDYVVPSRVQKGKFYALPQSPQLLKQILMISGFDKYFQLARCLRDEDLRADRQPEHTQIDVEMSYVTPDDVFVAMEAMMSDVFQKVLGVTLKTPFPRYTYEDVMSRWGIDKPDLRFGMEIVDLTDLVRNCSFKVFADNIASGGVVKAIVAPGTGSYSRKQIDALTAVAKEHGAGGLAYVLKTDSETKSPIAKFLGDDLVAKLCDHCGVNSGDGLFIISDRPLRAESVLGQLRLHFRNELKLIGGKREYEFLWVTKFPLFEYDEESGQFIAMHNIVSHPIDEDLALIDEGRTTSLPGTDVNHPWRRARADQYDLVVNGWEIGSGGRRINRRDLQEKILAVLGIDQERADRMFGFLLRALEYGAPPHAGIALGLDRIVALMAGTDSIRDVIAFPKTANAISLMDSAPSPIEPEQLDELGITLKRREDG